AAASAYARKTRQVTEQGEYRKHAGRTERMKLDIKDIMARLPHRYPMLLIDRVLEMDPGKSIVAIKNVSMNEPFFEGHFPHHPVMPGVLIIEAMAQAAALFSFEGDSTVNAANSKIAYYL